MQRLTNPNILISPEALFEFCSSLCDKVRSHFDSLGDSARTYLDSKNQKGDRQLIGDIECEKIIIEEITRSGIPCVILSEEHGEVNLSRGQKDHYTIVLDGLDGSKFAEQDLASDFYGTVIGILKGASPLYSDAIATCFVKHARNINQIYANPNSSHQEFGWQYEFISRTELLVSIDAPIQRHNPQNFEALRTAFPQYITIPSGKSFADIVQGGLDAFVRRLSNGSLELAGFAAALRHSGACAKTLSGQNLWTTQYLENCNS